MEERQEKRPKSMALLKIFSVALTLYLGNIKRFLLLSFMIGFPMIGLDLFILQNVLSLEISSMSPGYIVSTFVIGSFIGILFPVTLVVISMETYNHLLKKQLPMDKVVGDAFKKLSLILSSGLVVQFLYVMFYLTFGNLAWYIFVPIKYLLTIFFTLYPFVIAFEEVGAIDALRRSYMIVRGNFFKLVILRVVVDIISPMNLWHLDIIDLLPIRPELFTVFSFSVIEAITLPLQVLVLVIFYFDLRRNSENLNLKV